MAKVILLGPPGCGKGTQAARLSKMLAVPAISTGDMLREQMQQGSSLGMAAKECIERG
ncbi:MAG: nucleoside monophosphate kinase, partial [Betaproteobacteria bacterium]|nr:nucleoside monophosphate kinase [Betaproteobacteria bacterium]